MKILKFGGTSLASAQRIINAAHLIDGNSNNLVVLSAMSGITNTLSDIYLDLLNGNSEKALDQISKINLHFNETAYQLFEKSDYDLVSLDYALPGYINGMDVYGHIRATDKTTPILFISGNIEFLESIKELKQKDIHIDHLSKPCQNKEYVNSINKLFERSLA